MSKKYIWLAILLSTLLHIQVNACAPFTTNNIIIWKYNWKIKWTLPYEWGSKWKNQFIYIKNIERPFSKATQKKWKYYFVNDSRVNLDTYNKWDFIIAIADYINWDFEDYFSVPEMWKISCRNNDDFYIEKREWMIRWFGKDIWACWPVPEYILSERQILKKIKEKYKTCDAIIKTEKKMKESEDKKTKNIPWYKAFFNWISNLF